MRAKQRSTRVDDDDDNDVDDVLSAHITYSEVYKILLLISVISERNVQR